MALYSVDELRLKKMSPQLRQIKNNLVELKLNKECAKVGSAKAETGVDNETKALNRIFSGHSIISIMEEENLITIDLIRLIR